MIDVEKLLKELSENGFKITNQRKIIIDIILEGECKTCKEIFYLANKKDSTIGVATVYRTINLLEELGIIDRTNNFQLCNKNCENNSGCCCIVLKDNKTINLSKKDWHEAFVEGLKIKGYIDSDEVENIIYNIKNIEKLK